ncbi:MAG: bifunctional phosphopantothenoylcysteine decarboxylase/phosphopantothenate--cysteine ligase CoaBC [Pseudomonadales bacterium]
MSELSGKNILLGITGGIAAFKAPMLVRLLRDSGVDVQVVMTAAAHRFVTPTTLQAVSGRPVRDDLWDAAAEAAMGHIELARWADLVVIAPATAHCMATLAQGLADNLLATLCLATTAPILVVPAMNQAMWSSAATQRNLSKLIADGYSIIGPDEGDQACGDTGPGRMVEPPAIVDRIRQRLVAPVLAGVKMLITAGPTVEAIDPVRFISNYSSGKQGYAIAQAAVNAGAEVTLVSGPTNLAPPSGVRMIAVQSAHDMFDAVHAEVADQNVVIGVAAVADYRPAEQARQKLKKKSHKMHLVLDQNPDIIASVAALKNKPLVVGFAAETEQPIEHARAKRVRKGLDAIVVNDVSKQDIGFNSDYNSATLIWAQGELALPFQTKDELAMSLIRHLADIFVSQLAITNPESATN